LTEFSSKSDPHSKCVCGSYNKQVVEINAVVSIIDLHKFCNEFQSFFLATNVFEHVTNLPFTSLRSDIGPVDFKF
jgi:hypothetical protein